MSHPVVRAGSARFPGGKTFAFTVFDDTDWSTLENVHPVYDFLADLGFRTTKSVWPLASVPEGHVPGASLADEEYRRFVVRLSESGFEIALHGVRNHDAPRELVSAGLERFRDVIGRYPRLHANHSMNRENIYWGSARLSCRATRVFYDATTRLSRRRYFEGHVGSSPFFWGDLCQEHIEYVRNFVFPEINLDRINPTMPYHDPARPYVNGWFSSTDGENADAFCAALTEANQDRLEAEAGVCIMYTHFGKGFVSRGRISRRFTDLMRRLARKNGWFVQVGELLDHLGSHQRREIPARELSRMERRWLAHKLRVGTR